MDGGTGGAGGAGKVEGSGGGGGGGGIGPIGIAFNGGKASNLTTLFEGDDYYTTATKNAHSLPTFLGNHDMGRIGWMIETDNPGASETELLARDRGSAAQIAHCHLVVLGLDGGLVQHWPVRGGLPLGPVIRRKPCRGDAQGFGERACRLCFACQGKSFG